MMLINRSLKGWLADEQDSLKTGSGQTTPVLARAEYNNTEEHAHLNITII